MAAGVVAGFAISLGACTQMNGEREAYLHSRQIIVEMDVAPVDEPVTRFASWPGPEHNLTLVRGDSLFPTELARATPVTTVTEEMTRP